MSSLQKFHRRTNVIVVASGYAIGSEAPVAGSGFWLGTAGDGTSKLIVAPLSTEIAAAWAQAGYLATVRGTTSTTNGVANTNTLVSYGTHPAANACKNLTTGGYNTWYLPAINELITMYSNKSATPFATSNAFVSTRGKYYHSSTENTGNHAIGLDMVSGGQYTTDSKHYTFATRATRRI